MEIEKTYYGDFIVRDELYFSLRSLTAAQTKIYWDFGKNVTEWPITIELNVKTMLWEVWFLSPYTEEDDD